MSKSNNCPSPSSPQHLLECLPAVVGAYMLPMTPALREDLAGSLPWPSPGAPTASVSSDRGMTMYMAHALWVVSAAVRRQVMEDDKPSPSACSFLVYVLMSTLVRKPSISHHHSAQAMFFSILSRFI